MGYFQQRVLNWASLFIQTQQISDEHQKHDWFRYEFSPMNVGVIFHLTVFHHRLGLQFIQLNLTLYLW
jgi:hypothetical protein